MSRALRIEYPGAFYHIISRGNEGKDIYRDDNDRRRFLEYLAEQVIRYGVKVHAYCLMNNHYHMVIETPQPNLTKIMQTLNTSYTIYFNRRHKRFGHLLQGRYKAILVQSDEYLHHLSRYIHLNPVRIKAVKVPEDYPWSSYVYYITAKRPPEFVTTEFILAMFAEDEVKARKLYKEFVAENAENIGKEADIIRKNITQGIILGGSDFVNWVKEKFITDKRDREIPALRQLGEKVSFQQIVSEVDKQIKEPNLNRKICIYLIRKYTDSKLSEIGKLYGGISYAGISQICRRMDKERKQNRQIDLLISKVEKMLNVKI